MLADLDLHKLHVSCHQRCRSIVVQNWARGSFWPNLAQLYAVQDMLNLGMFKLISILRNINTATPDVVCFSTNCRDLWQVFSGRRPPKGVINQCQHSVGFEHCPPPPTRLSPILTKDHHPFFCVTIEFLP